MPACSKTDRLVGRVLYAVVAGVDHHELVMRKTEWRHGSASEPALFFIHGDFGDGFDTWGPVSTTIGRRYRTVTVDRPGFGGWLNHRDRFTITGEAVSLMVVADEMGLETFHLVGHSYGALIALEMAVTHPGRVRTLHLIEPPLLDLLPADTGVQHMRETVRTIQAQHAVVGADATTEAFFTMIGAAHVPERLRGTREWDRLCIFAERFARGESVGDYPSQVLNRIPSELPIGIYSGGRSHPVFRAIAMALLTRLEGARFTDVAMAGHAVQLSGDPFVDPLLALVTDADALWEQRNSPLDTDNARE